MSSINKTPHYNLSQFGDSPDDKPSWRGDYTGDMSKIDSQMYRNETDATTATSTANTAKTTADSALSLAQANKADITEQESYFNALGVTSAQTAQALMSTINGKAENTALTSLQGTVSSLSDTVNGKANTAEVYTKAQADARYTQQGGYSGTAQALNQRIDTNTSNITAMQSWQDAWHDWTSLGDFNYTVTPSQIAVLPNISNIQCYYNETLGMIKVFGSFGCEGSSQSAPNFNSITIKSSQPLPAGMRPSSQINMIATMWWFMNGSGYNLYSYDQLLSSRAAVIVDTSGYVHIGEMTSSGTYTTSVGTHARQGARIVLPQSIYTLTQ
jgi:hypothetical protein